MAVSRISLRVRLLAYFMAITTIGVVGIGIGFAFLSSTGRVATRQYEAVTVPYSCLMRVSVDLQRIATGIRDVIIADNDSDLVRAMTFLDGQAADMDGAAADYLKCQLTKDSRERFLVFQEKYASYLQNVRGLSAKAEKGERSTLSGSLKALRGQAQGLQASIDTLASAMDADALKQSKAAGSSVGLARAAFSLFAALSVVLSLAFGLVLSKSIAEPMRRMSDLAANIAEGNLCYDFDAAERRDEIGALSAAICGMKGGILDNIGHIKAATSSLDEMGKALESNARAAAGASEAIVRSVAQAKSLVAEQGAGVTETSATTEQILKSIESLDVEIEAQADNVARSSASVEEMVANIRTVAKSVEALGLSFGELGSASDSGRRMIEEMSSRIAAISSQSEKLDEANGVVSSIATQTNLLAMNAAIEAAHAGQSGKGFAVVADEIRKLAESAAGESKEISRDIGEIKLTIESMVPASRETSNAFAEIMRLIAALGSMEDEIKRALVEQSEGSKEVLEAITRIEEVTASVRRGSAEIREGSRSIATEMRELMEDSVAMGGAIGEIERVASGVKEVSGDLGIIADGASLQVTALARLLDRYKLPVEAATELAAELALEPESPLPI